MCDKLQQNKYSVADDALVRQLQAEYIEEEFVNAYKGYLTSVQQKKDQFQQDTRLSEALLIIKIGEV